MIDFVWILVAKRVRGFHDNCHVYMEWIHWKKKSKETFRHQGNGLAKIMDKKKGIQLRSNACLKELIRMH